MLFIHNSIDQKDGLFSFSFFKNWAEALYKHHSTTINLNAAPIILSAFENSLSLSQIEHIIDSYQEDIGDIHLSLIREQWTPDTTLFSPLPEDITFEPSQTELEPLVTKPKTKIETTPTKKPKDKDFQSIEKFLVDSINQINPEIGEIDPSAYCLYQ